MSESKSGLTLQEQSFLNNIGNYVRRYKSGEKIPSEDVYQVCSRTEKENISYEKFCEKILSLYKKFNPENYNFPFIINIVPNKEKNYSFLISY